MVKTVCIDARWWGVGHTGIGRYVENLIENLPHDPEVKVVLIVHPSLKDEPKLARFEKYYAYRYVYSIASLFELAWLLARIRPDLLHIPHTTVPWFWPGKIVVTVHDLIKHYSTGVEASTHGPILYWVKYLQYRAMVWAAFLRASQIIVPSNYWKNELVIKRGIPAEKVWVTYEGISQQFFHSPTRTYKLPFKEEFLVYTGNLYPHKNVALLVQAANRIKMNLAVICARDVFATRLPKSRYVHFLGRLTDEQLVSVYQQATAFVFPSLIEGFGLPGLEAMATGLPVISSDASCLPEIYGQAALYFNPASVDDLEEKIKLVVTDQKLRQELIKKGRQQVSKYSWAKMASQTWQIYLDELR